MHFLRAHSVAVLYVAGALALGFAFNYSEFLWLVGFIALVPLFFAIDRYGSSLMRVFLLGWGFGAVFLGVVLFWFWNTLPLDWFGITDITFSIFTVFISWSFVTATLSSFIGLFALLFRALKGGAVRNLLLAPSLWVLSEFLRTFGFSILTAGPGSISGPHFSVGFLGYLLANNSIILSLSTFGGVYTLSGFVVLVNILLYQLATDRSVSIKRVACVSMGILATIALYALPHYLHVEGSTPAQEISVAVLHTAFEPSLAMSQNESKRRFSILKGLIERIPADDMEPDIIVLPEDSRFLFTLFASGKAKEFFDGLFGDREVLIIDSSRVRDASGTVRSRMFYFNTKTGQVATADKLFLVPQGEYIPYLYDLIASVVGRSDAVEAFSKNRSYQRGEEVRPVSFKDISVGGLFCSDVLSPVFYEDLVGQGADVLVNVASQSLFHGSRILYGQVQNIAKVRAAEHHRYFIQASNGSPSFILDSRGSIVAESSRETPSVLYGKVPIRAREDAETS